MPDSEGGLSDALRCGMLAMCDGEFFFKEHRTQTISLKNSPYAKFSVT
jgi:hypothetical protein